MSLFPRTPSFTNLSFVDAPNLLTGHSYLRHTLHVFVRPSGLTLLQIVPLPSTHHSDWLSSSVCNLMRRCPMHLLTLAYGAWKSPVIYPVSRMLSAGRPRYIPSYWRCSDDSDSWCWDSTTQPASDDTPSQHRSWRGLLSVSSEVRACHGRATMPGKSSRGVHVSNTSSLLPSDWPEYSMSIIQFISHFFRAPHSGCKNH